MISPKVDALLSFIKDALMQLRYQMRRMQRTTEVTLDQHQDGRNQP